MTQFLPYVIVAVLGLVLYGLGRVTMAQLRRGGADAARADRAEADAKTVEKQSAILLENRSPEDAARDLDSGNF